MTTQQQAIIGTLLHSRLSYIFQQSLDAYHHFKNGGKYKGIPVEFDTQHWIKPDKDKIRACLGGMFLLHRIYDHTKPLVYDNFRGVVKGAGIEHGLVEHEVLIDILFILDYLSKGQMEEARKLYLDMRSRVLAQPAAVFTWLQAIPNVSVILPDVNARAWEGAMTNIYIKLKNRRL
jgi:hypothetical protein